MSGLISLLPIIFVLICAIMTHRVHLSLFLGIVSAAFIAFYHNPLHALYLVGSTLYQHVTTPDNIAVFLFLISLGIIIMLMQQTGAIYTYVRRMRSFITTPQRAELMSICTGLVFFLDDYLSAFTTGALIGPLFDDMRIPRLKLAYLINATVPALCVLIPATSWTAMILSQMRISGIAQDTTNPAIYHDTFHAYLETIGFLLYPILSITTAIMIIITQTSYGLMRRHEETTAETSQQEHHQHTIKHHAPFTAFLMPVILFLLTSVITFLYTGNASVLGGTHDILTAIGNADAFTSLAAAASISMFISFIYMISRGYISSGDIGHIMYNGFRLMQGSLGVLILAWSFSSMLQHHLHTMSYLATLVTSHVTLWMLPTLIFGITALITASTGSSWGTIALMVPLTIQLLYEMATGEPPLAFGQLPHAHPAIAAVLSGAVAGGHVSPISDATIVASTSAQSPHMPHVISQIQYAIPPLTGALCGYLVIGFTNMSYISALSTGVVTGFLITVLTLYLCQYKAKGA